MKNLLTAVILTALFLVTVLSWFLSTSFDLSTPLYIRSLGILFAALGLVTILMQFVLVSRVRVIEASTGLDRLLGLHRFLGRTGLVFLLAHALLIIIYRLTVFGDLFLTIYIWLAVLVLLGLMITGALASQHKRIGLAYETWRNIHLLNYLLFPLVLVHVFYYSTPGSPLYNLWLGLAFLYTLLILYRLFRILAIRISPYEVSEVKEENADTWSLFFSGKKIPYKPGQFLFVQLLRKGHLSSAHPFTISSSPTRENFSITIRDSGDFTSTIGDTKPGDRAYLDAPYGLFSFLNFSCDELVFLAGGIGITPFISMLRYLYDLESEKKVTLFWSNRNEEKLCFAGELEQMRREMANLDIILVMTGQSEWSGYKERIDVALIKEELGTLSGKEFFLCGPAEMIKTLSTGLRAAGVKREKIHSERFAL